MDQSRYIVIQEWMLDLGLKGSELLVYALIWGFSQDDDSDFHGSAAYVARWCGVSRQQATSILKKLTDAELVNKTVVSGFPAHYRIIRAGGVKFLGMSNDLTRGVKKVDRGCQETLHNNNRDNIDIRKYTHSSTRARESEKTFYGDKVQMTAEEHASLVSRFGETDAARLIEILDDYLVIHPKKKYASHYRAILSWCVTKLQEDKLTEQRLTNAQQASRRISGQPSIPVQDRTSAEDAARRQAEIDAKYQ